MRAFLKSLIVIVLPLLALTGCFDKYVVRQKVVLSVQTPSGEKTASSVEEISYTPPLLKGPAAGFDNATITRRGEAVVLEVAPGRYLFELLSENRDPWNVFFPGEGPQATIEKFKAMTGATRELSSSQYPLLVTFDDINNPSSVKRVNPANLEATFGPGYRLNGITLSLTKEPVTKGEVEKVLGWLPASNFIIRPEQQPRYVKDQTIEQKLMPSDFIDGSTLKSLRRNEQNKRQSQRNLFSR